MGHVRRRCHVTATLTAGGSPLAGKLVSISVGPATQSDTTDTDGKVTVTIPLLAAAGDYPLAATFVGDENTQPTSELAPFSIQKAPSVVTVTCPATVAWTGSPLAPCTATATGEDLNQPLVVTYGANTNVGTGSASAIFYGDAAHTGNQDTAPFEIVRADQAITFVEVTNDKSFGDPPFTLSATASSGLPVAFTASGSCAIAAPPAPANTVVITAAGPCVLTASQAGNGSYEPAPDAQQTLDIGKQDQTIGFAVLPAKTYGDPDFTVSATSTSTLPVSFAASGDCEMTGSA